MLKWIESDAEICTSVRTNLGELVTEGTVVLAHVLDTFVNDPLVEWTSGARGGVNSLAHDALKRIESRLSGVVVGVGAAPSATTRPLIIRSPNPWAVAHCARSVDRHLGGFQLELRPAVYGADRAALDFGRRA